MHIAFSRKKNFWSPLKKKLIHDLKPQTKCPFVNALDQCFLQLFLETRHTWSNPVYSLYLMNIYINQSKQSVLYQYL